MRITLLLFCCLYMLNAEAQNAEITANTKYFAVDKYYALNSSGQHQRYKVSGFYEPGAANTRPRVFILPQIAVDYAHIKYFANGTSVSPLASLSNVTSINIPMSLSASLPNDSESVGIASQLDNVAQSAYYPKPIRNLSGQPPMLPTTAPAAINAIQLAYKDADTLWARQERKLQKFRSYQTEITGIDELVIKLLIDGEEIAERRVSGSVTGSLPVLAVRNPSRDIIERIKGGNFEVLVSYRFRDAKVGTVDASFDVARIIDDYIKETQKAISSSKSSGMQILGFGSRRNKVKQQLQQQIESSTSSLNRAKTTIIMSDADEGQIARFEKTFFPSLTQSETIEAHLNAAKEAEQLGKVDLAKIHLEYATALQKGVEIAEVDAVGAAAALNQGDYATFLAKGVRFMDASTKTSGSFFKVVKDHVSLEDKKQWTDVHKVSVIRQLTEILQKEEDVAYSGVMGISGFWFNPFVGRPGVMVTCMSETSALLQAGVVNGEVIWKIDSTPINTIADMDLALSGYRPGDQVGITLIDAYGNTKAINVTLKQGIPRP